MNHKMNQRARDANESLYRQDINSSLDKIISLLEKILEAQQKDSADNQEFKSDSLVQCNHQGAYTDTGGWHCPKCGSNIVTA